MSSIVTDVLANRSSQEKNALLLELLRELIQRHPDQPFPIVDEGGVPVGMFAPLPMKLTDTVFAEGTPGFFAELQRRRQENDRIPVDEYLGQLRARQSP